MDWKNWNHSLFGENLSIWFGWSPRWQWTSPQHANVTVQQPLVASSLQCALKPAMHIANKVFDSNIVLLASFVTAVDNSSSYEPTALSFCNFLSILLLLSNNTENVLFYKVKWHHWLGQVDYQYANSCTLFLQCCLLLTENYNNAFEFVKFIIQNIVNPYTVTTEFLMTLTSQLGQQYLVICQYMDKVF